MRTSAAASFSTLVGTGSGPAEHAVTRSWQSTATWNTHDGVSPWFTPGGDFSGVPAATKSNVGAAGGGAYWYLTKLVQGWVDGEANHGLLVKQDSETVDNLLGFATYADGSADPKTVPYLEVDYERYPGLFPSYILEGDIPPDTGADDDDDGIASPALTANVNVANGNLIIGEQDLDVAATGPDVEVKRFYNSFGDALTPGAPGLAGAGMTLTAGGDIRLDVASEDGPVVLHGPSGYVKPFERGPNGSFVTPQGLEATLIRNADGSYRLELLDAEETYEFSATGRLTAKVDATERRLRYSYDHYGFTATDADYRQTRFTYGTGFLVKQIREPSGALHSYERVNGRLTAYTDPTGRTSRYSYVGGRLVRVQGRDGSDVRVTYDASGRVTALTRVTDPVLGTGPTTQFEYRTPAAPCDVAGGDRLMTVVTQPDGSRNTYCFKSDLALSYSDLPGLPIEDPGDPGPDDPAPYPELDECITTDPDWPTTYCGGDALPHEEAETAGALTVNSFFRWGISDNGAISLPGEPQTDMFADRRFEPLEVTRLRRIVPWDLVTRGAAAPAGSIDRRRYDETIAWVQKTEALTSPNVVPLISFEACRGDTMYRYQNPNNAADPLNGQDVRCRGGMDVPPGVAPSPGQYAQAVRAFLTHPVLGRVNEFTAWNEPNHGSQDNTDQPTWDHPYRAGQYFRVLNELCTQRQFACRVAAGDFLDSRMRNVRGQRPDPPRGRTDPPTGADQYAVWYWRWYLRGAGGRVLRQDGLRWAWHAYSDGRRAPLRSADQRWTRYKKFNQELAAVYPDSRVWATEQGVVLHAGTLLEAGRSAAIRNDGMRAFVRGENSFVELPRVARFY